MNPPSTKAFLVYVRTEQQFSFEVFDNVSKVYVSVEDLVVRRMFVDLDRLLFLFD